LILTLAAPAAAQSTIAPDQKFAWQENAGWLNWRDAESAAAGVAIRIGSGRRFLEGFIWAENLGWIHTGGGDGPYDNATADNFGVNIEANGLLDGFAWSESAGWINFDTALQLGADAARFEDGRFKGYAWGENIGWINLDDADAFVAVIDCPADLDGDGVVSAGDLAALISRWGQTNPSVPADLDGDGVIGAGDLAALIAAWGPCD
jgi:hypothetical protein